MNSDMIAGMGLMLFFVVFLAAVVAAIFNWNEIWNKISSRYGKLKAKVVKRSRSKKDRIRGLEMELRTANSKLNEANDREHKSNEAQKNFDRLVRHDLPGCANLAGVELGARSMPIRLVSDGRLVKVMQEVGVLDLTLELGHPSYMITVKQTDSDHGVVSFPANADLSFDRARSIAGLLKAPVRARPSTTASDLQEAH